MFMCMYIIQSILPQYSVHVAHMYGHVYAGVLVHYIRKENLLQMLVHQWLCIPLPTCVHNYIPEQYIGVVSYRPSKHLLCLPVYLLLVDLALTYIIQTLAYLHNMSYNCSLLCIIAFAFACKGYLYITGRIKEILITRGGENIAPVPIEERMMDQMKLLSYCMVLGDNQKYLTMFVTLRCEVGGCGLWSRDVHVICVVAMWWSTIGV